MRDIAHETVSVADELITDEMMVHYESLSLLELLNIANKIIGRKFMPT